MLSTAQLLAAEVLQVEFDIDDDGFVTSANPILPPIKEVIVGGAASIIVFVALWRLAGPAVKKAMQGRTDRIQTELDEAAAAKVTAETEAAEIRTALGDIDAERSRLFDEADAEAAALLENGRARLDAEIADLEAKATADVAAAEGRGADDLRSEISRYSAAAIDEAVTSGLDDATQQQLIEDFISRVGAQNGVNA
ncbi:MAG: hypothetical protein AAGD33_22120 [Actinomycetota bacterium]